MKRKNQSWYKRLSFRQRNTLWGIIFLLPWMIGMLLFFLGPLLKTFYYSLNDMKLGVAGIQYTFIGISNFIKALAENADFNQLLLTAIGEACLNVPVMIVVSLFLALLLNGNYWGRGFFRMIFFIPIILATGLASMEMSGTDYVVRESTSNTVINTGFLAQFFILSGLPQSVISYLVQFVSTIFNVITVSGIQMLIFLAGLQSISPSLYEVAKIEGATSYETFCRVTLPMVSPMILLCVVYSFSDSFYRAKLTDEIYKVAFTKSQYGLSASMSVLYLISSIVVIGIVSLVISRRVFYYDK
ncbi:MAG TPA: sugar ABC transporter permease [Mobilitalea sp.]|nr:sugar ABC transporter permease [Mobilitalea sp.]